MNARRSWMRGMLAGLAVVGLAGVAAAQAMTVSGKIVGIDPQLQQMKLRTGWFTTREFSVAPDASITAGQRELELEQLQRGAEATVEYVEEDGKRVAQSISIKEEGAAESAAPSASQPSEPLAPPTATPESSELPEQGTSAPAPSGEVAPPGGNY